MYSLIADRIVLPAIDWVRGTRISANLRLYRKSQWWDRERLAAYRDRLLRKIIHHCYQNVPFYKETFKKRKLAPEDIQTIDDLTKLPIIDKQIIKKNYDAFFDQNINRKKLLRFQTSGSTGEPFTYYLDKHAWSSNWACGFRTWEVSGWRETRP